MWIFRLSHFLLYFSFLIMRTLGHDRRPYPLRNLYVVSLGCAATQRFCCIYLFMDILAAIAVSFNSNSSRSNFCLNSALINLIDNTFWIPNTTRALTAASQADHNTRPLITLLPLSLGTFFFFFIFAFSFFWFALSYLLTNFSTHNWKYKTHNLVLSHQMCFRNK